MMRLIPWAAMAALLAVGCTPAGGGGGGNDEQIGAEDRTDHDTQQNEESHEDGANDRSMNGGQELAPSGDGVQLFRAHDLPCSRFMRDTVENVSVHWRHIGEHSVSSPLWEARTEQGGGRMQVHPGGQPAGEYIDLGMLSPLEARSSACWYRFDDREAEGECGLNESHVRFTLTPASCETGAEGTFDVQSLTVDSEGQSLRITTQGQATWYDRQGRARVALGTCNDAPCEIVVQYDDERSSDDWPQALR